jgi:hypothetical protein
MGWRWEEFGGSVTIKFLIFFFKKSPLNFLNKFCFKVFFAKLKKNLLKI